MTTREPSESARNLAHEVRDLTTHAHAVDACQRALDAARAAALDEAEKAWRASVAEAERIYNEEEGCLHIPAYFESIATRALHALKEKPRE